MLTSFALYRSKIFNVFSFAFSSSVINASLINLLAEIIHSCESLLLVVRQMPVLFTALVETILARYCNKARQDKYPDRQAR